MAEALINLLLEELVTVAFDYTKEAVTLIRNAKIEVKKFSSKLKVIQAVLEDAEKQQVENASVRNWLDALNDVSYEMVDVLDEWNTEILKQKAMGVVTAKKKKTFRKVCFSIHSKCYCFGQVDRASHLYKIATEIKELNEKLTLIAAQKEQFHFDQSSTRSNVEQLIKPLETSSFVDISKIFGRGEATADLLSKLLSDSSDDDGKRVPVILIVGMGGIGKTTLAQLVCKNENVQTYFEKIIWVCVSNPFDGVKIAKAIISGTGNDAPSSILQDVLQCMSRCLEGKKCLIVLDDVWTEDQTEWESLKLQIIMITCAEGSKILVTTRKERVVEIMGANTHMIQLEKLSDESCLALFNSIAYLGREEDEDNGFGALGGKIAKKCNGLPLAARTLGALMRHKTKRREWQEVLDSKIWLVKEVEQQVFRPFLLSYNELAPTIKRCLLYCATFPKDYRFNKQNLIELWMSHDYLSGKDYTEKEETGQLIFDTLVMRYFLQDVVEEVSKWDMIITVFCKMHIIVHDFVQFLNKNECFTTDAKVRADGTMIVISDEVRHLTLMYAPCGYPLLDFVSAVNSGKLRTLATFDSRMSSMDIKAISQLKCLRALNLSRNDIGELPNGMGELIHLRYLDLSENEELEKLPDSVCNLYNLQTLSLSGCGLLQKLPENMGNLINLRHLHNKYCYSLEYLPRGIGRLTSLQTLNECPVIDDKEGLKLGDLGSLDQLQGCLFIKIKGNLKDTTSEALKAPLSNKKLYYLDLDLELLEKQRQVQVLEALCPHKDLESLRINQYGGTTAPSWMKSLQNLRSLTLRSWDGCECLPPLGKLPFLEQLSVEGMKKVKRVGEEFFGILDTQTPSSSVLFPRLKQVTFKDMAVWEQWEGVGWCAENNGGSNTTMPCLVSLEIRGCPKLMNLPHFLRNTPVREVVIRECRRSIRMPNFSDNCHVCIDGKTEVKRTDERVETELQNDSQRDVLGVVPIQPWWRYFARCGILMVFAIMVTILCMKIGA